MSKPKQHFDIGVWSREKKAKRQEIIANNCTIVELKDCIKTSEAKIKDLKRKVAKFTNVFLLKVWLRFSISNSVDEIANWKGLYLTFKCC